ncbi:hypothetical protein [Microbacterium sp. UCD-TDU]|uniref:hypothetical protein n=1 Tax=Microbacterium sp. UCD-TDU TaxID=1247714 RepID=UPI00035C7470|nr:hypothetical protein [Microbacterium sp. UCD-TDU]EYT61657.1 hypothetical protein D514_0102355 [Microbacterium sp. UCD-TDU]
MAQFASTLYPQTNPSNPILLKFRASGGNQANLIWLQVLDRPWLYGAYGEDFTWSLAQIDHARRVLTRLAALSG